MMNEQDWMNQVRATWETRCNNMDLRPGTQARDREMTAFLQGVLATATATNCMTMERASMIAFLVTVGRGEEFLAERAPWSPPEATPAPPDSLTKAQEMDNDH